MREKQQREGGEEEKKGREIGEVKRKERKGVREGKGNQGRRGASQAHRAPFPSPIIACRHTYFVFIPPIRCHADTLIRCHADMLIRCEADIYIC